MDWAAPLGTAIGAVAGVSSAVVVERARWSLGRNDRRNDQRKATYAAFLGALARAVEQIWNAARQQQTDRPEAALSALRDHRVQETRFELALSAPADVARQAEVVAAKLVSLREAVADGASWDGEAYKNAWDDYYKSREEMIRSMRSSLGAHD
jgi:hypothetical protein